MKFKEKPSSPQPSEIEQEKIKEEIDTDLENALDTERNFVFQLIDDGEGSTVAESLISRIYKIHHRAIAQKLFDAGYGLLVLNNLDKFSGLNSLEIASKIIEVGAGWAVADNLDKFPKLTYGK